MTEYVLLGRSGLRVSRFCLGTMTFGTDWGWGSPEDTSRQIFNEFLNSGANFIDTADGYTNGTSETLIGKFLKERGDRDRVVLATKFGFRRLQTDYIDLYWLHNWDTLTPPEEVMSTLDDLVRSGKIRYVGFSNCSGWYLGRAQTLAELRGYERIVALQLEYSLAERNIEREHVPAALEFGMGITPWSPLAGGLLTGRYQASGGNLSGEGRLNAVREHPAFATLFTERNWAIGGELVKVAKEIGRSPAQVALNWVANRPAVSSTIIGASKVQQLHDNLAALDFTIPRELLKRLNDVSAPETHYPYYFFAGEFTKMVSSGTTVLRSAAKRAA